MLTVKGYGVLQVRWLNISRLRNLQQKASDTSDPIERLSLNAISERCETLRGRWVLGEPDLALIDNTRSLVQQIAELHYPESAQPLAEARIEKILNAFLENENACPAVDPTAGDSGMDAVPIAAFGVVVGSVGA